MAGQGGVSFMRLVFQTTQESIEEKESSIRDMIAGYKKGNAAAGTPSTGATGERGGKVAGEGGKSADALTTAQSLELQFEMGQYSQMATGGSNIIKSIKDLLSLIMRNVS